MKKHNPSDKIEQWPIDRLIPYARNARTHSDAQVAQIAASMIEWGWTTPVLASPDGQIIAGHGRVLAARKLGIGTIPVMVADEWTEAQTRAYVIADNQLALNSGWDADLLKLELDDLAELDFDLELIGLGQDEIGEPDGVQELDGMPELPAGDRAPFQQMIFTLHDTQVGQVGAAMNAAKRLGKFVDSPNENGNGNALARICEIFMMQNGNG